jgi:NAD(P) transhydrogenase
MLYLTITQFIVFFTDIVLKVRQPMTNEVGQFKDGGTLISFLYPGQNKDLVDQLLAKKLTAFGKLASSEHHR